MIVYINGKLYDSENTIISVKFTDSDIKTLKYSLNTKDKWHGYICFADKNDKETALHHINDMKKVMKHRKTISKETMEEIDDALREIIIDEHIYDAMDNVTAEVSDLPVLSYTKLQFDYDLADIKEYNTLDNIAKEFKLQNVKHSNNDDYMDAINKKLAKTGLVVFKTNHNKYVIFFRGKCEDISDVH